MLRALALASWPVKPDKAEAIYEHGLLRIEGSKNPMEDAVKVAIKQAVAETNPAVITNSQATARPLGAAVTSRWPANRPTH